MMEEERKKSEGRKGKICRRSVGCGRRRTENKRRVGETKKSEGR